MSYPIPYSSDEIERLTLQSTNLSEPLLLELSRNAKKILEIGCGVGSNLNAILKENGEVDYTGVDVSSDGIANALKRFASKSNVKFYVQDANFLNFEDAVYDFVLVRLVLWGSASRDKILAEAYRVLAPGGLIYCFEPDDQMLLIYPPKD